jgi:hypothetical protein
MPLISPSGSENVGFFFWKALYFVVSYVLLSTKNNCLVACGKRHLQRIVTSILVVLPNNHFHNTVT